MTEATGLIVGASGGIGSACARVLSPSVDRVVLAGRDPGRLAQVAVDVGPSASVVAADVATPEGRSAICAALDTPEAQLRWVVLASGRPLRGALADLDEGSIEETFAINLIGPTLLLKRLAEAPWASVGTVVIIGSLAAARALPERSAYAASKAGLERLALNLAVEWAPRGIHVSVVAPGVIATPFLGSAQADLDAWVTERVPARRMGTSEEIAEVVRWLCTDAPGYLAGARISIDGGAEVAG